MTGIQRITNFPIAAVRAGIVITVVSIGWYLGGTVGVGTLLFAFELHAVALVYIWLGNSLIDFCLKKLLIFNVLEKFYDRVSKHIV